jgi:acyl carrier protein
MKRMNTRLTEKQIAQAQDILMEELDVNREQLTPESRIEEDLGADSLTMVQIVMKMEDVFKVVLSYEVVEKAVTVEKLYETLANQLGQ